MNFLITVTGLTLLLVMCMLTSILISLSTKLLVVTQLIKINKWSNQSYYTMHQRIHPFKWWSNYWWHCARSFDLCQETSVMFICFQIYEGVQIQYPSYLIVRYSSLFYEICAGSIFMIIILLTRQGHKGWFSLHGEKNIDYMEK